MEKIKKEILNKIQKEIEITLKKINEEFIKKNIFWFAHSGTLLGIVRHNGKIIPWDDDVDMAMPYESYLKNKNKIQKILNQNNMELIDIFDQGNIYPRFKSKKQNTFKYNDKLIKYNIFIDLMITIPRKTLSKNTFFYFLSTIPGRTIAMYNNKNVNSWYLHFFTPKTLMFYFIKRKLKKSLKYSSNFQIKYDHWLDRKYVYNLQEFQLTKFYDFNIWVNSKHIDELNVWYNNNWKNKIYHEPHIFKYL